MDKIVDDSFDAAMASEFGSASDQDFLPSAADTQRELDGPVLTTRWMVYDREFADGQREICASKFVTIKGLANRSGHAKRGESEKREENLKDSIKRAKQAVRHRCKAISADRMLTLTYRENVQDIQRVMKDFDAFRRRMKKLPGGFEYVATLERQERGAFHIHLAIHGRLAAEVVRRFWLDIVGGKGMGNIDLTDPRKFGKNGRHKIAAYIAKYIGKDVDDRERNKKRYWSSRGIIVPEKNYYQLPYGTTEAEAYEHVLRLAVAANNDGMVFFSNSGLGVCWVATPPVARCGGN